MKLKPYREQIGKTQKEVAQELGITVVYYSDLEREVYQPSPLLAIKIEEWSMCEVARGELRPDLWP